MPPSTTFFPFAFLRPDYSKRSGKPTRGAQKKLWKEKRIAWKAIHHRARRASISTVPPTLFSVGIGSVPALLKFLNYSSMAEKLFLFLAHFTTFQSVRFKSNKSHSHSIFMLFAWDLVWGLCGCDVARESLENRILI